MVFFLWPNDNRVYICMEGFVVTMHSDLCEQYVKSLGVTPSGFDFLFRTRPRALWQQTPPEPVLIP